jgi:hypothetical protein
VETLAERITRDGPVNELDAIGWAIRLAKRLESLHQLGVAHGSVSPACILTTGQDRNARAYLADVQHTTPSPAYQSPERILGGDISTADDVWGLASTLYALLTGQSPFAGGSDAEIRQKIMAAAPAPLAVFDVGDDDLQHILDRAFSREIAHRTTAVTLFRRSLEEWHPDRGVATLPPLEDEDSTNDDDDVARTVMVRDASAYMAQKLAIPVSAPQASAAAAPDDDEDEDNIRTVMRQMPQDDLAAIIAKATAAQAPARAPAPAAAPAPARAPAPPLFGRGGPTAAAAPPAHAPFPRTAGAALPQPGHAPFPARPAPAAPFGGRPGPASAPQPVFGAPRPAPPAPAPPPQQPDLGDDDEEDDNARTMMRNPEQYLAALDAVKAATGPAFPQPAPAAFPQPAPAAAQPWGPPGGNDGPAPAPTMALPAYDGPPPALGNHGTQPMAAVSLEQIQAAAGTGTVPIPAAIAEQLAAVRAQQGAFGPAAPPPGGPVFGGMAAPGDLSALEAPPPPQPAPLVPADPAAMLAAAPPKSGGKAGLIIAAVIALLIAAAVTFVILRSRMG